MEPNVSGGFHDTLVITELRGQYPNVPISADVDFAALTAGDVNPVFLTLPIGKAGVTSGNKRHYDDAFVMELERQTLNLKPVGLMGHLSNDQRSWAMPPEALHWVGATRVGELLWGKAYIVPGEHRDRINRYKAQGKAMATSIDAHADGTWDESLKAYRMDAKTLRLGQIDLAPADRAGIPDLAAVPLLTSEMDDELHAKVFVKEEEHPPLPRNSQEKPMDKLQVINEMTADDARLLPTAVRDAVVAAIPEAPEIALVSELCSTLGVNSQADLTQTVRGLVEEQTNTRKSAIRSRIIELATPDPTRTDDKAIKVGSVRAVVVEMVQARSPKDVAEVESIYNEVATSQLVGDLLKTSIKETMGPNQRVPVAGQPQQGKYFDIPQDA